MPDTAVQDHYPDAFAHCYGCGRHNPSGLHIRSVREGDEVVARFAPRPEHVALPGYVYGGLIASLVDCHGIGTAAVAAVEARGAQLGDGEAPRFVTASLHVDYLAPTPHGPELVLRARPREVAGRRVTVEVTLEAEGKVTARGEVVGVELTPGMMPPPR